MIEKHKYASLLKQAVEDLQQLNLQKAAIDTKIIGLTKAIEGLRVMLDIKSPSNLEIALQNKANEQIGITDSIRAVLRHARVPFTTASIRAALEVSGSIDPERYSNLMAVINTVLGRLIDAGEVRRVVHVAQPIRYEWVGK